MATLATQQIAQAGIVPTYAAAAGGGDKFTPGDNVFLHVKNGHSSPQTVTVDSKVASNYGTDVNLAVAVTNASEAMIGPLPAQRFQGSDGLGDLSYSGVTALTIAVVRL